MSLSCVSNNSIMASSCLKNYDCSNNFINSIAESVSRARPRLRGSRNSCRSSSNLNPSSILLQDSPNVWRNIVKLINFKRKRSNSTSGSISSECSSNKNANDSSVSTKSTRLSFAESEDLINVSSPYHFYGKSHLF